MRDVYISIKGSISKVRGAVIFVGKEGVVILEDYRKNFWGVGLVWIVINGCICFLMFFNCKYILCIFL